MRFSLFAAILAASLLLSGCGKSEDTGTPTADSAATTGGTATTGTEEPGTAKKLVGSWTQVGNPSETSTATFADDGTFSVSGTGAMAEVPSVTVVMKGTYTVDGDEITRTFESVDIQGTTDDKVAEIKKVLEGQMHKPLKGKIEWVSDTELKFTGDEGTVTTWKKT
jgi:hypothetical protein